MDGPSKNLTWFITGCSSGFGLALARLALSSGHHVIGTSRNPPPDLVSEFESRGGQLITLDIDDSRSGDVLSKINQSTSIDVLVNNAGWSIHGPVESFSDDEVRAEMETLYFGPMRLVRTVVPSMRRRGKGIVVSISSGAGVEGRESMGAYAPGKAAIDSAMKILAKEMAPFDVRVLTVQLGAFDTPFAAGAKRTKIGEEVERAYAGSMTEKVMGAITDGNFNPDGDHLKATRAIYDVIVGDGVGKTHEGERVLPLGRDMAVRIDEVIEGWQHTMEVFGDICGRVHKE